VAFSLALTRINEEQSLRTSTDPEIIVEANVRKAMFTAVTVLVLFTVFVQVSLLLGVGVAWRRGGASRLVLLVSELLVIYL